jgi:hypothetical protein
MDYHSHRLDGSVRVVREPLDTDAAFVRAGTGGVIADIALAAELDDGTVDTA